MLQIKTLLPNVKKLRNAPTKKRNEIKSTIKTEQDLIQASKNNPKLIFIYSGHKWMKILVNGLFIEEGTYFNFDDASGEKYNLRSQSQSVSYMGNLTNPDLYFANTIFTEFTSIPLAELLSNKNIRMEVAYE